MEASGPVVVFGHHRSGTTWLGSVLGEADGHVAVPHELSNPRSGYRLGGQQLPPYVTWDQLPQPRTDRALAALRRRPRRTLFPRRSIRSVLPGRRWRATPVFKDPLGSFVAGPLTERLGGRGVVVMRHPGATYTSLIRVGWHESQPGLDAGADPAVVFAHRWVEIYDSLLATAAERGWPVVRHEDLSVEPFEAFPALFERAGLPWSEAVEGYLRRTTSGDSATPAGGVVHELTRDSSRVATAWRAKLDADVLDRILAVTAPLTDEWF